MLMEDLPPCQAYPPVPNWYTSHCAAVSDPNYYVYATRNTIVVLDLSSFRFVRAFIAAKDKIQAIAAHQQFCFAGGADNVIRAWSLSNGSLLMTYNVHSTEVTVIKCIRDGKILVSGDKSGKVVLQEPFNKKRYTINKISSEVRTIAPLHHAGDDYLAVGYANGMIHIEKVLESDLKTETVYQLNHADGDGIHSLSWQLSSPSHPDIFPLLASSTKKLKNAIIWNVVEEARYSELRLPVPSPHWTDQQRNSVWFELAWSPIKDDEIYVTSYMGMIVQYRLKGRRAVEENRFREVHSRIAFNFTWVQNGRFAVTYSIDKQIILWDIRKRDAVCRMLTQSGFLYSLDIPTWNPGQVAIGLGDSNIKIWDFMDTSGLNGEKHNFYQCQLLWKGLQGQILNVQWHPTRENILAYSTEYGRVGIYDIAKSKCFTFKTYYQSKGQVFISWAFDIQLDDKPFLREAIITCNPEGIVYAYDAKQHNTRAIVVNDYIQQVNPKWCTTLEAKVKTSRCCSAVDPQSRFLALGNTDGVVEVYRLDTFQIIYVASSQQVAVTSLAWNGPAGPALLAVGYKSGTITIHNIAEQMDDVPEVPIPDTSSVQTFTIHKKMITSLEWSHHQDRSLLASVSKDEFACVFDANNTTPLAFFDQHRAAVLSVCWGIENLDTVFTGGEDKFCYVWKYTDYPYNAAQKKKGPRRVMEMQIIEPTLDSKQSQQVSSFKRPDPSPTLESNKKRKKGDGGSGTGGIVKISELMNGLKRSSNIVGQPQLVRHCMQLAVRIYGGDLDDAIQTVKGRISPDINPTEYEYVSFLDRQEQNEDEDSKVIGLFFGDKNAMKALIGMEVENSSSGKTSGHVESSYYGRLLLEIMQSNHQAFESNVADWVALALSPMAGKETWLNLMEKKAIFLANSNNPVLAATCFLACSKVYEAIRVYREANLYREAIAIAKLRLPAVDPIIPQLFAEWGDKLQKEATQEELAAMCFLHSNLPGSSTNAINLLVRRKKESYIFWAACLAVLLKDNTAEERISQYLQVLNERLVRKQSTQQQQQQQQ